MHLSNFQLLSGESVIRDAEFANFGMVADVAERLCVPAGNAELINEALANANVVAIVCTAAHAELVPDSLGLCVAASPLDVVYRNHVVRVEAGLCRAQMPSQISDTAVIHPTAYVSEQDVSIGKRTVIGPLAVVEFGSVIGDDCVIGPGVVIGGNGYQVIEVDGKRRVIPHGGGVRLGDRVELQANTSVTRSLFSGFTEIGDDTAVDNLVYVAHNVRIGKRCRLVGCSMICGSATLGDDVWVGPNAVVSNGLNLGDGAWVTIGSVVTRDIVAGQKVTGNFAIDHEDFLKSFKFMRNAKNLR